MKTLTHYLKIVGMLTLGCWIVGLMLAAAYKFTLGLISVTFWGLILVGISGLGEILIYLFF